MAFEKVIYFGNRNGKALCVHIRMDGQIYIATGVCLAYPITSEHLTADIYVDSESDQLAIIPVKSKLGHFRLSKAGEIARSISCRRFLKEYQIIRNEKCECEIKTVNGERMIVFQIKRVKKLPESEVSDD